MESNKMSKLDKTRKKGINTLISLAIIAVAVFLGFTPLYNLIEGGVAGAIVGSAFAAIFVIILTMYLLNKQTEVEQESKRGERIFDEKMSIYRQIFEDIQSMLEDGKISKDKEMQKLPFVMLKLIAIGSDKVIKEFQNVYDAINNVFHEKPENDVVIIEDDKRKKIMEFLGNFSNECRVDLGVSNERVDAELFKGTQKSIEVSSVLLSGVNAPIVDKNNLPIKKIKVLIDDDKYQIYRYKKEQIRIYKNDNKEPEKNSKSVLRMIDEKYKLNLNEKDWQQTQRAGRAVINKLEEIAKHYKTEIEVMRS